MGQFRQYKSLESAIKALKLDHFSCVFEFKDKQLCCSSNAKCYDAEELQLIEYHRFETEATGMTAIVFAIQCDDGTKGLLSYTYDTKIDMEIISFFDKVRIGSEDEVSIET